MKKKKQKNNLGMIIGILMIILAALAMMFVVTVYYQNRQEPYEVETTAERQPIKIPDITNPPAVQESTAEEPETQALQQPEVTEAMEAEQSTAAEFITEEKITEEQQEGIEEQTTLKESDMSEEDVLTEEQKTDVQMTQDDYRSQVYAETLLLSGSHLVDLTNYAAPTANELFTMIEAYTVPDRPYLDGEARTAGDFSYTINRRNLGQIHDPVELRYGVLVKNASVRSFPTWQKLSNGTSASDPDALQETGLSAGEGVIVLHQSADQIWSFVQAGYYNGWIQTSTIGFCTEEEMEAFADPETFAVITVPYVEIGGINLKMGTKLPASAFTESSCVVKMPQADSEGNLTVLEVSVSREYLSEGYLELSSELIEEQAKKLLGVHYGWGDSNNYMDCTSTLRAVYNCFGITLPRNTSWMPNCALKVIDLREMGTEQKKQVITSLKAGSILLVNGHAMMYIGQENGQESMLHNVTQYLPSTGNELEKPMKCVITPIDIRNSAGVSYIELYRYAISIDWDKID